jgi:hypothetical protein
VGDLDTAIARLDWLESSRQRKIAKLLAEKATLEKELPPSLVALTEQVEHASKLQQSLKKLADCNRKVEEHTASFGLRSAWATFIESVPNDFARAEVSLSTTKTNCFGNRLPKNVRRGHEKRRDGALALAIGHL